MYRLLGLGGLLLLASFMSKGKTQVGGSRRHRGGAAGQTLSLYYVNWCGYCTALKPEWAILEKEAVKDMPNVTIKKIDGDTLKEPVEGVESYPTIMFNDGNKNHIYSGERTAKKIKEWVQTLQKAS